MTALDIVDQVVIGDCDELGLDFKNHFLKEAGVELYKYKISPQVLASLSKDGNNEAAIKYFINLIKKSN